jgi:hypothetical protein
MEHYKAPCSIAGRDILGAGNNRTLHLDQVLLGGSYQGGNLRRMILKDLNLKPFGSAILVMSECQNVVLLVVPAGADK